MRALVTGCAGFVASHLTESLLSDGWAVLGVDCFNDNYGRRQKLRNLELAQEWEDFDFVPIDLARGDLNELLVGADVVYHFAAEPGVRPSWGSRFELYVRNNVLATQHLLEATRQAPGKRFVYASSSSVYGQAAAFPTHETTNPAPHSPYGTTKLAGEHLCQLYAANWGVDTVSLRFFSLYGPRQRPDMAFNRFCAAALEAEPIEVFGGGQTRDFTYISDALAAARAAGETPGLRGETINVGGGSQITLEAAIKVIEELAGHPLEVHQTAPRPGDVQDTGADIGKAERLLHYEPKVALAEGLRSEWEWSVEQRARGAVGR